MASKSGELRVALLGLALLGLLLLSQHAAPVDAAEGDAPATPAGPAKKKNSFSFNKVDENSNPGGRTLSSFSMNHERTGGEKGAGDKGN